jgi:hypothetical protein
VSSPADTLLDIAPAIEFKRLRQALGEAQFLRIVSLETVAAALRRGKAGSAALRRALESHLPQLARTRSQLEIEFLLLCERHSLPLPEVNVRIAGWVVDAVWREHRIGVELDSRLAHEAPWTLERDHRRDVDLRAAGYTPLRYTWAQLTGEPERVASDLRRSFAARA